TVQALQAGEIDVALLFSTSSAIGENGWVLLEDDKNLQNTDLITPVVRTEVLEASPDIEELLNSVSAELDTETMTELNRRVEIDQEDPAVVAEDFLTEAGLLG
ncbi:MAG TPA: glycine betaine ABC transporter substrate-binding protein, partial [Actinomycetota bacterium]|nr:glycine betaine ABC transporter substrate-binding protein [Actinomycetota bacterium]